MFHVARYLCLVLATCLVLLAPVVRAEDTARHEGHGDWAFRPPSRPAVPAVEASSWIANPIDAFVLEKLASKGLSPNRPADRSELLRRLSFDLIGLPPTVEERTRFLADRAPDAHSRLVERLLASPHFGERWAQHWLDVVRYAETEGFKADSLRVNAYKFRDYVIQSFNADRPYDQFVRQQLAGDELEPGNPQALIATGLNRLYPDENNAANTFQRRDEILNDITKTNSLAFMGLTMGCAQCHDHKFDAIPQIDYYRMRAIFAPMIEREDVPAATLPERRRYQERFAVWQKATTDIRREMDELLAEPRKKSDDYNLQKFRPEIQDCVHTPAGERTPLQEQIARMVLKQLAWRFVPVDAVKKLPEDSRLRYQGLEKRLAEFDDLKPDPLPGAMTISDVGHEAPTSYLLASGNFRKPQQEVQPGFPVLLGSSEPAAPRASAGSTGRRSALARWLTRRDHPLTARVIVNRIWQHYFGRGIVPTVNDFGVMGGSPTHEKVLDWLSVELMDHGWSLKHIHRMIVTSATYRQSSRISRRDHSQHALALVVDKANDLLWRQRRRRLEGEAIRDAMLAVCGQLNIQLLGPSVRPPLPDGISKRYAWKADADAANHARRSIYVFVKRNMRFPLFDAFDLPDLHSSCGQRSSTTTAPQALLMLNSEVTLGFARRWAERLIRRHGDDRRALVTDAYVGAFGRSASEDEVGAALAFLMECTRESVTDDHDAVTDFCHAILNANEFIMID